MVFVFIPHRFSVQIPSEPGSAYSKTQDCVLRKSLNTTQPQPLLFTTQIRGQGRKWDMWTFDMSACVCVCAHVYVCRSRDLSG